LKDLKKVKHLPVLMSSERHFEIDIEAVCGKIWTVVYLALMLCGLNIASKPLYKRL
jgi:hypothetical protein